MRVDVRQVGIQDARRDERLEAQIIAAHDEAGPVECRAEGAPDQDVRRSYLQAGSDLPQQVNRTIMPFLTATLTLSSMSTRPSLESSAMPWPRAVCRPPGDPKPCRRRP